MLQNFATDNEISPIVGPGQVVDTALAKDISRCTYQTGILLGQIND